MAWLHGINPVDLHKTRPEAREKGARYYVGALCCNGHEHGGGSVRYTSSATCVDCVVSNVRRFKEKGYETTPLRIEIDRINDSKESDYWETLI